MNVILGIDFRLLFSNALILVLDLPAANFHYLNLLPRNPNTGTMKKIIDDEPGNFRKNIIHLVCHAKLFGVFGRL